MWHELGISQVRAHLEKREVTPVEIVRDVVEVIDSRDRDLSAYLDVYADEAIASARELTKSGRYLDLPLGGIPIAVKDNICVAGKRMTCGSRILEDYVSPYSATAVDNLERAGALILGKTNCDEFGMGSSNENSAFGPTKNPWNLARVPGGSSGGSAVAVAARMAFGALGSDTGGSLRLPASFCGVVGMKPTYGRVSRYGLVAFASSLDQVGPIARTVGDTALLMQTVCGHDARDSTSLPAHVPDYVSSLDAGLDGLTIGIPSKFLATQMSSEMAAKINSVVDDLRSEGVKLKNVRLPHATDAVAAYYVIANAEASANLARFDGVKYGYRSRNSETLGQMYTSSRGEGFGAEVKRRILLGTYVLSAGYYDAYYLKAQKVRSLVLRDFQEALRNCDLVMMPTAPTPAFKLGEKISDPVAMYMSDVLTVTANLTGLPAISLPCGLSVDRLPIGVQLIGRALDETTVLRGARGLERIVDFGETPFE